MPAKKGARTPSPKKTPGRPTRQRARSASRSRKTSSRSRSVERKPTSPETRSKTPTRHEEVAPALPARKAPTLKEKLPKTPPRSPARVTKSVTVTREMTGETPIRVSARLQEKVLSQVTRRVITEKRDTIDGVTTTTMTSKSSASGDGSLSSGGETIGPLAAFLIIFVVIGMTYIVPLACTKKSCTIMKLPHCPAKLSAFFNLEVILITFGFFAVLSLLSMLPVGYITEGLRLKDGRKLKYRCNGMWVLLLMAAAFCYAYYHGCPLDYFEKHLLHFVTAGMIYAFIGAIATLMIWRNCPLLERAPGADGTFFNDFWMGRPLNPRIGSEFDIKFVLFRASLLVWLIIDWIYLVQQFKNTGVVSPALSMVVLFHTLYAVFAILNEHVFITTLDITAEGFGFMLSAAYFVFIPIVYSFTARYIYLYPDNAISNPYYLCAAATLEAVGLVIFHGANWQKSEFRKNPYNPALSHLTSMSTLTGKRLLTSGWWGVIRRPNYLGDLIMAVAWSLPCGCSHALPYLYPLYLIVLLVSRCINDEKSCRQRYGDKDWDKYTSIVKYRLIPYVF